MEEEKSMHEASERAGIWRRGERWKRREVVKGGRGRCEGDEKKKKKKKRPKRLKRTIEAKE